MTHPLLQRHAQVHRTLPWATAGAGTPLAQETDLPADVRGLSGAQALGGALVLFFLAYGTPLLARALRP